MSFKEQPNFKYAPLASARGSIRLIKLEPGSLRDPIRCHLFDYSLLAPPQAVPPKRITALSYMWGSTQETRKWIFLDDKPFHVQPNLHAALGAIRSLTERDGYISSTLWIDAICINQSDIEERNQQVGLMSLIYTKVDSVLVWLGPAAENSDDVFQWMSTFSGGESEEHVALPDTTRKALVALCNRPYWERAWIQQEISLTQHAMVMCGSREVLWLAFVYGCCGFGHGRITDSTAASFLLSSFQLGKAPPRTLEQLILGSAVLSDCYDIRDRIFSLLSLASDLGDESKRMADYGITPEMLYFGVLGVCNSDDKVKLATNLAIVLGVRRTQLLKLFSDSKDKMGDPGTDGKGGLLEEHIGSPRVGSVWKTEALRFLQSILNSYAPPPINDNEQLSPSGHAAHTSESRRGVQATQSDIMTSIFGDRVAPGDLLYGIEQTDIGLIFREDLFGPYLLDFARRTGQHEWTVFQPDASASSPEVKNAGKIVEIILARDMRSLVRGTALETGFLRGVRPEKQAALVFCHDPEALAMLLDSMRRAGELCLVTFGKVLPLFERTFKYLVTADEFIGVPPGT